MKLDPTGGIAPRATRHFLASLDPAPCTPALRVAAPSPRITPVSMLRALAGVIALGFALGACAPPVAQAVKGTLSVERGTECRRACSTLGMRLTSVVLIMNSTGCVCQVIDAAPPGSSASGPTAGGPAAAGGAEIAAVAAAQQQQQQSSQPSK